MASLLLCRLRQHPCFFKDRAREELDAYSARLFEQTGERNSEHSCWQYFCVLPDIASDSAAMIEIEWFFFVGLAEPALLV